MLKCFFVISIVIPCEAEGPDKAFNCVCHRVGRGGRACAFHPVLGEAQPKPLPGPPRSLVVEEPEHRDRTGYVTLHSFALHIAKNTGWLPFGHQVGTLLSQGGFLPRGLQSGREASAQRPAFSWAPGPSQGVTRRVQPVPRMLFLSWLNEIIHRSASHLTVSVRSSSPKVKASFVIGFS